MDENKKNNTEELGNEAKNLQNTMSQEKNTEKINSETSKDNINSKINKLEHKTLFMQMKGLQDIRYESRFNIDKLSREDFDFIKTCLENPSITLNNLNFQNTNLALAIHNQDNQVSYKSFNVSKGLFNIIEHSFKAQKPVRLDFNGNSSVILKMNNEGKLIAEFISNDKAMEYALKSSISTLKEKLDSEGIPYDKISYKDNSKNNNKRQNKEQNDDNN